MLSLDLKPFCSIAQFTLFRNKKYSIESYYFNSKFNLCIVKDEILVDYPILYDNGDVGYDYPELFPKYIKNKVKKQLELYKEFEDFNIKPE